MDCQQSKCEGRLGLRSFVNICTNRSFDAVDAINALTVSASIAKWSNSETDSTDSADDTDITDNCLAVEKLSKFNFSVISDNQSAIHCSVDQSDQTNALNSFRFRAIHLYSFLSSQMI